MATLGAQLKTDLDALLVDPHYDETDLTRICVLAAAKVKRYAGSVDGSDDEAVEVGLRYAMYLVKFQFNLASQELLLTEMQQLESDLSDLRAARQQEGGEPVMALDYEDDPDADS